MSFKLPPLERATLRRVALDYLRLFSLGLPVGICYGWIITEDQTVIPIERIAASIYLIRNQKVMLDRDLAELYDVKAIALRQQVKRNMERFPDDFMFQVNDEEVEILVSQNVIPSRKVLGGHLPYAFTQEGVAMLSSVLRSTRAVQVNITIMRTFIRLREILATHRDVARKIEEHDRQIANLYNHVEKLLTPPKKKKNQIGYIWTKDDDQADSEKEK